MTAEFVVVVCLQAQKPKVYVHAIDFNLLDRKEDIEVQSVVFLFARSL